MNRALKAILLFLLIPVILFLMGWIAANGEAIDNVITTL